MRACRLIGDFGCRSQSCLLGLGGCLWFLLLFVLLVLWFLRALPLRRRGSSRRLLGRGIVCGWGLRFGVLLGIGGLSFCLFWLILRFGRGLPTGFLLLRERFLGRLVLGCRGSWVGLSMWLLFVWGIGCCPWLMYVRCPDISIAWFWQCRNIFIISKPYKT